MYLSCLQDLVYQLGEKSNLSKVSGGSGGSPVLMLCKSSNCKILNYSIQIFEESYRFDTTLKFVLGDYGAGHGNVGLALAVLGYKSYNWDLKEGIFFFNSLLSFHLLQYTVPYLISATLPHHKTFHMRYLASQHLTISYNDSTWGRNRRD
jgi:hypothetical protein